MNGSSVQSDEASNPEARNEQAVHQHPGFLRQLSSSVDGSQSDLQSVSEQAPVLAEHAGQQAQTADVQDQPRTASHSAQVDAWPQSEAEPDVATTSASLDSGAREVLTGCNCKPSLLVLCCLTSGHTCIVYDDTHHELGLVPHAAFLPLHGMVLLPSTVKGANR